MFGLSTSLTVLLFVSIIAALAFEFINGFHDTANAVATVIFTRSLKPGIAVILSGCMNFLGVYIGGIAVAMGIVNLLPISVLVDLNIYHSIAMVFALIITAILWNLGTWWLGLPCSSSHTLIGSIFGVGLAFSFLPGSQGVALNWHKVQEVLMSLFISPVIGFGLSFGIMILLQYLLKKDNKIFEGRKKKKDRPAPFMRSILILTSTMVSFSHGSNDGQKGVGLIMIILIVIMPYKFALNTNKDLNHLNPVVTRYENNIASIDTSKQELENISILSQIQVKINNIQSLLLSTSDNSKISKDDRVKIRKDILLISKDFDRMNTNEPDKPKITIPKEQQIALKKDLSEMKEYTSYAPYWVILMVSLSLGLGTMIGWKNIVLTIGSKIGKTPLNYAQGATSQLVAASTIWISSLLGLPVSTTHVLSSGIAGSMVAKKRKGNLKAKTIRNIAIAWLVTLPFTIIASGAIFYGLWFLLK